MPEKVATFRVVGEVFVELIALLGVKRLSRGRGWNI